jgi:trehalose 6-phosphate synthase/phosphatase
MSRTSSFVDSGALVGVDVAATSRALFIVSNRLPFVLKRGEDGELTAEASAGGLVTALLPLMTQSCSHSSSLWVGWPGLFVDEGTQQSFAALSPCPVATGARFGQEYTRLRSLHEVGTCVARSVVRPDRSLSSSLAFASVRVFVVRTVMLTHAELALYYEGFSNKTLWPLFHSEATRTVFREDYFFGYEAVNHKFCTRVMTEIQGACVCASSSDRYLSFARVPLYQLFCSRISAFFRNSCTYSPPPACGCLSVVP